VGATVVEGAVAVNLIEGESVAPEAGPTDTDALASRAAADGAVVGGTVVGVVVVGGGDVVVGAVVGGGGAVVGGDVVGTVEGGGAVVGGVVVVGVGFSILFDTVTTPSPKMANSWGPSTASAASNMASASLSVTVVPAFLGGGAMTSPP
jgi:hypothetical protein